MSFIVGYNNNTNEIKWHIFMFVCKVKLYRFVENDQNMFVRQLTGSSLVQIMTWLGRCVNQCFFCWLDHISVECQLKYNFHTRKWISKCRLRNGGRFVSASMCSHFKSGSRALFLNVHYDLWACILRLIIPGYQDRHTVDYTKFYFLEISSMKWFWVTV